MSSLKQETILVLCELLYIELCDPMYYSCGDRRSGIGSGEPCCFVPASQTEDFHCLSGQLRELGG